MLSDIIHGIDFNVNSGFFNEVNDWKCCSKLYAFIISTAWLDILYPTLIGNTFPQIQGGHISGV